MPPRTDEVLRELLVPVVEAVGFELDSLSVTPAGRRTVVRVTVDGDSPVDLDTVAEISRAISDALDSADALGDRAYVLEVGSPGVERPLTERRHWRRAVGRLVEVSPPPGAGAAVTGRLVAVSDGGVHLEVDGSGRDVDWAAIGRARVQVEFRRPGDTDADAEDPADDDGEDPVDDDGEDPAEDAAEDPADEPPGRRTVVVGTVVAGPEVEEPEIGQVSASRGGGTTWTST